MIVLDLNILYFFLQFWSAVLPLDVAKTIIQTAPDKCSPTNPFQVLNSVRPSDSLSLYITVWHWPFLAQGDGGSVTEVL